MSLKRLPWSSETGMICEIRGLCINGTKTALETKPDMSDANNPFRCSRRASGQVYYSNCLEFRHYFLGQLENLVYQGFGRDHSVRYQDFGIVPVTRMINAFD